MRIKILFWLLLMILIVPNIVDAAIVPYNISYLSNNLRAYYTLNNTWTDESGGQSIIPVGSPVWVASVNSSLANGSHFAHDVGYGNLTRNHTFRTEWNFSISMWVKYTGAISTSISCLDFTANQGFALMEYGANRGVVNINDAPVLTYNVNDNQWFHQILTHSNDTLTIYINGTYENSTSAHPSIIYNDTKELFVGINDMVSGFYQDVYVDELIFFNKTLSSVEAHNIFIGNFSGGGGEVPEDKLNITAYNPANNTQFNNAVVAFNVTVDSPDDDFDCILYINDTLEDSTTFGAGWGVLADFNETLTDGAYNYSIYCEQIGNATQNETTGTHIFYVDTVYPYIDTNFSDGSVIIGTHHLLVGQVNFSDDFMIHRVNVTIDDSIIVFNKTEVNSQLFVYNMSYNASTLSVGKHNLTFLVADGHTAEALKGDYEWSNGLFNNYLEFDLYGKGYVTIKNKQSSIFDSWSANKEKDRYTFDFVPSNTKQQEYTFSVESDLPIHIYDNPDAPWGKWIVMGDHWLDFDSGTKPTKVNRISEKEVEFIVPNNLKDDVFKFSSIGDLNILSVNYSFYVNNVTATYPSAVIESETQTNTLNVTTYGIVDLDVAYYYDDTYAFILPASGTNWTYYTKTFSTPQANNEVDTKYIIWYYNWTDNNGNSGQELLNLSQTVYQVGIGNCSNASWYPAITFYSYDEKNDTQLTNLSLNIDFQVWYEDENLFRNFSFGFPPTSYNHSICIYPNASTYKVNSIMEYYEYHNASIESLYQDRKYYLRNYTLDNTTDTVKLYNILTADASAVTLRGYDSTTGQPVEDAYIHILRYYPEQGAYKTVEIERTDNTGQTLAKMQLYDVFYKYMAMYNGQVVLDTGVEKVISTTKLLPLTLSEDVLDSFVKIGDVDISVTCTNETKTCRVTWADDNNIVQEVSFYVYRMDGYGKHLIYNATTESVAGTMVYTITESTDGRNYRAEAMIHTNTEFSDYIMPFAELYHGQTLSNWGGLSVMFPALLLLLSISFALLDVGAIGVIIGSILGLFILVIVGIIPVTIYWLISLVICAGLLVVKIKQ